MADRKAELERKKQKLELMRKERQEKERLRKLKEVLLLSSHFTPDHHCTAHDSTESEQLTSDISSYSLTWAKE